MDKKIIIRKVVFEIIGIILLALGVTGIIVTELGASSLDAFNVFFGKLVKIETGTATLITNAVIAVILFALTRNFKLVFSIVVGILIGLCINFWQPLLNNIFNIGDANSIMNHYWFSIPFGLVSIVIVAIGAAILIIEKLPMSSYDELTLYLSKKIGSYHKTKVLLDTFFLILAIILGLITKLLTTQINFFTIIVVIGVGPTINFILRIYEKRKEKKNAIE
ncbi:YczE/YyaS/YitT family protein [Haploplasma axanthum]|uniref:YitT family protein n=1 Tax=Haploplasma axanthum TaxID=29552 RepID=A0A449BEH2_HAPAX|nr:hypothetical protein [Haploplasma axanthum]VEU80822.1 Uncharacterised protein [Haploplasma axanthum]